MPSLEINSAPITQGLHGPKGQGGQRGRDLLLTTHSIGSGSGVLKMLQGLAGTVIRESGAGSLGLMKCEQRLL